MGEALTGDALLEFVNARLFPTLKALPVNEDTPRGKTIVKEIFSDLNQYMKNGILLRQVVNVIDEIDFSDVEDRHTFGDIYEGILKDLQSAGNAGEFYTPRALTDFMVEILNPQLGESFGDFTSGTGGFLTSALNHLYKQVKTTNDVKLFQTAVIGQEWKPLPYLLSITNLLVHDIEAPNIIHCDSLGTRVGDFKECDKVNVIAMNPPYGGSTEASVKNNFPSDMRSSETADLFMVLIMYRLKANGRAAVIVPDGFLFGVDGAKLAIKTKLLKILIYILLFVCLEVFFLLIQVLLQIFLFFNNERVEDAPEGYSTKETWFYRLDMPDGYKHFSKTKPMKLEHCQPIKEWWHDRKEIVSQDGNEKSRCFSVQDLISLDCNLINVNFLKMRKKSCHLQNYLLIILRSVQLLIMR